MVEHNTRQEQTSHCLTFPLQTAFNTDLAPDEKKKSKMEGSLLELLERGHAEMSIKTLSELRINLKIQIQCTVWKSKSVILSRYLQKVITDDSKTQHQTLPTDHGSTFPLR